MKPLVVLRILPVSFLLVAGFVTGCATPTDQATLQCGNDYSCLSDMAFRYRQQADELSKLAQRYELEAAAMTEDDQAAKQRRDRAQAFRVEAKQADELAQEYRNQLPHNMAH